LTLLANQNATAQQCLLQMARDKNATARFHAVAFLKAYLPEALRAEIVGLALSDRSVKVRLKGIEGAEKFKFRQFLARLEDLQRTDTNAQIQYSLAIHLPVLRDGYYLRPSGDGLGYFLVVRGPRSFGGPFIPNEKCSEQFVRDEVARIQRENS
jgi:hypothetical protein